MYSVENSRKADKILKKLDSYIRKIIKKGLKKLEKNPIPSDAKFITRHKGDKVFRVRIGDYRVLYKLKKKENIVLIANIDKRPRIYHRM